MTDRTPAALVTSLALHALIVAVLLLFTYSVNERAKVAPKIFELVAGEGNNYMATKAPALGSPDAVKLNLPAPTVPKPEAAQPEPPKPEPAPITPAPVPVTPPPKAAPTAKAPPTPRTPAQEIRRLIANADRKAKREVAKEREDEQKRLTKEEFDKQNKAKTDKSTPPKVAKIDGPGIAKGVAGGSPDNTKGGAGGKALTADDGAAMDRYFSKLKQDLEQALEKPAGVGDTLVTTVEFHIAADGTISGVRIVKPSGSREFDDAVRAAFRRVGSIGPRPDGKSEVVLLDFRAKDQDGE